MSVFDEVKKAFESVLAPDVQQIKADVKIINSRLDAMDEKLTYRFKGVDDKLDALEEKMNYRFEALNARFDTLLRELQLEKKLEDLQRRVDQVEVKQ